MHEVRGAELGRRGLKRFRRRPGRGRVAPGRQIVWTEALEELGAQRRSLLVVLGIVAGCVVFFNAMPGYPTYVRGLITGVLLAIAVWVVWWLMFVVSGLYERITGAGAEDWTNAELRRAPSVLGTVPNIQIGQRDIDAVAIASHAVYAIETKWVGRRYATRTLESMLDDFGVDAWQSARTLRYWLAQDHGRELPDDLVKAVLVVWGPGSRSLPDRDRRTLPTGDVITVRGHALRDWLSDIPNGPIGPDYARDLEADLEACARDADVRRRHGGRFVRFVSRPR